MITKITSAEDFLKKIQQDKKIVIDFYADWCGPCRAIAPKFLEMSTRLTSVDFYKLDIDQLSELASTLSIKSIPTFIVFENGKEIKRVVGGNLSELEQILLA